MSRCLPQALDGVFGGRPGGGSALLTPNGARAEADLSLQAPRQFNKSRATLAAAADAHADWMLTPQEKAARAAAVAAYGGVAPSSSGAAASASAAAEAAAEAAKVAAGRAAEALWRARTALDEARRAELAARALLEEGLPKVAASSGGSGDAHNDGGFVATVRAVLDAKVEAWERKQAGSCSSTAAGAAATVAGYVIISS